MIAHRRREAAVTALLLATIVGLLVLQSTGPWNDPPAGAARPWPVTQPAPEAVAIGVTTLALTRNSHRPWRAADLVEVNAFEQHARQHADIVMWFADWARASFDPAQAEAVARRGAVPEVSWEPWDARIALRRPQPRYTLASIIRGRHDAYVRHFAAAVARYGGPVRLRFAQEMNGRWYPWSESSNGNRPGEFVRAWRHVHAIFTAAGATNVQWVWAPVAGGIRRSQYPGHALVDVVGLSGFNGGRLLFRRAWRPFRVAFGPPLDAIHHLAPGKPVELTEIASTEAGGDKGLWIRSMFEEIRRRPYIRALVWFNLRKEADWRIESSARAQAAFAAGAATVRRPLSPATR